MDLGIVNRINGSRMTDTDNETYNAAMSTLMRTLRNLRKIGFKVCMLRSYTAVYSAN